MLPRVTVGLHVRNRFRCGRCALRGSTAKPSLCWRKPTCVTSFTPTQWFITGLILDSIHRLRARRSRRGSKEIDERLIANTCGIDRIVARAVSVRQHLHLPVSYRLRADQPVRAFEPFSLPRAIKLAEAKCHAGMLVDKGAVACR